MQKVLYILGQFRDEDIGWLSRNGTRESLRAGQELIREGEDVDAIYFVLDGAVDVIQSKAGHVATLGTGEIVGELSMIDKAPPSATVRAAANEATVLRIPKATLTRALDQDEAFAARFYRGLAIFLSDRLRATVSRLGYGTDDDGAEEDPYAKYELDEGLLDTAHIAGERFHHLLSMLQGRSAGAASS